MTQQPSAKSEPVMIRLNDQSREDVIRDLFEIRLRAETIVGHRDDPCRYWNGHGCEASMVHDAEDIIRLVDRLLPESPHG